MQTQTLVSKLLATEDISVVRQDTATASFNIEKRELVLPNWKNMSASMEMMLIGHEVSHALHTTQFYIDKIKEFNKPNFASYMNVVEDARIERMIKRKYPGLRKDFYTASQELYERDMMGTSKKSIAEFPFIDRINIFFKVGNHVLVTFTEAEQALVNKVDATVTEQDVFDVSVEIYKFESQPKEEQKKPEEGESQKSDDSDDSDDSEVGDGNEESKDETKEVTPAASETSSELDKSLSGMVSSTPSVNLKLDELYPVNLIEEKTFLTAARRLMYAMTTWEDINPRSINIFKINTDNYGKFRTSASKMVNHLVTEFEMRKAADQQKRTQEAKSGQLNMSRIAEYKIVDDMFKRFNIVSDAQNHGMIIMLDWSGSMSPRWKNTVEQLSILILFLKRVGIKFEVHAFSDNTYLLADADCSAVNESKNLSSYARKVSDIALKAIDIRQSKVSAVSNALAGDPCISYVDGKTPIIASIIKIASSKMTTPDIEYILKFLYVRPTNFFPNVGSPVNTAYSFGTTPTNQALIFEIGYVNKFQRENNIQKMNTVILTDGSPTSTSISYSNFWTSYVRPQTEMICTLKGSRVSISHIVGNDRNIPHNVSPHVMCILFKFFKNMTDSTLTMYYIAPSKVKKAKNDLSNLFQIKECDISDFIRPIISEVNKNSWAEIKHDTIDKLIYISSEEEGADIFQKIDGSKSASALAREITKNSVDSFNKKAFARTLIDTFN